MTNDTATTCKCTNSTHAYIKNVFNGAGNVVKEHECGTMCGFG